MLHSPSLPLATGRKPRWYFVLALALVSSLLNASPSFDDLRAKAEKGSARAQFEIGKRYFLGASVPRNPAKAAEWFRKSAEQGFAVSEFNLGVLYASGIGVPIDHAEAVSWFRKAAEQGDARAQYRLGVAYSNGDGAPQDPMEAVRWFQSIAEHGDIRAQYNLGILYASGIGIPKDNIRAIKWFRRAASGGYPDARFHLNVAYIIEQHGLNRIFEVLASVALLWILGDFFIRRFIKESAGNHQLALHWANKIRAWKVGRQVLPWLLLLTLISRRPDRLLVPQFLAEDGKIFFSQAYRAGIGVWFHPYAGYFDLTARMIAWSWAKLPWAWTPLAYNLSALAVWGLIIWRVGTARLPAGFRWLAAAAIVFTIHSGEIFLNITDLNWPLALILAVNLLEPHPKSSLETARRCIEVLIAGLSGPLILIALVGVALRSFSWRKQLKGWILISAFIAAAALQGFVLWHDNRPTHANLATVAIELPKVFPLYVSNLAGVAFFERCSADGLLLVGLSWCVAIALLIRHGLKPKDAGLAVALFLSAFACLAADRIATPYTLISSLDAINGRYTYVPLVLMTWLVAWIASRGKTRAIRRVALAMVCLAFLSSLIEWQGYSNADYHWRTQVRQAESGLRRKFEIPPGWQFPTPNSNQGNQRTQQPSVQNASQDKIPGVCRNRPANNSSHH